MTVQFGKPIRFEQVAEPTRDQAQEASEVVFEQVRAMHGRLRTEGRRSVVRAARSAGRAAESAAESAARRPISAD